LPFVVGTHGPMTSSKNSQLNPNYDVTSPTKSSNPKLPNFLLINFLHF